MARHRVYLVMAVTVVWLQVAAALELQSMVEPPALVALVVTALSVSILGKGTI
jgi:hypothetical protein